ncbi:MAG TPA: hemolysin family protein [Euzebyales bacterium]|nr:hemolysin family protein [Euzebyales bacterium]
MTGAHWAALAGAVLLLVLAAVFETAKAALTRVSVPRAEKLCDERVAGAQTLLQLVQRLAQTVAALGLLSTMVRAALVALGAAMGLELVGGGIGLVTGTVVAALLLYIVADVVPARVVRTHPERVGGRLARVVRPLVVALGPLAHFIARIGVGGASGEGEEPAQVVTEDHVRDLIDVAVAADALPASRSAMLQAVFDLDDTVVREIMVPRPDVISVSAKATLEDVVTTILNAGHSRIPVYGADRDEIDGVIYAKDVLALLHTGDVRPWQELLRPPLVVPELKSVEQLLRELQVQQVHLAVVVDEYGATVGVVTIEDILEELVGEIVDEYDHEVTLVEPLDGGRWRVDARLPVDDLAALVDTRLPDEEWDTVGGLLFGLLGHIATPGERVAVDGIRLTAEQVRGRRISKVLVERHPGDEDEGT